MSKSRMMSRAFSEVRRVSNVSTRTFGLRSRMRCVAGPDRRLLGGELSYVPIVHVHVDEATQPTVVREQVLSQGGVLAGEPVQELRDARGLDLDGVASTDVRAERRGNQDGDCHTAFCSSMVMDSSSNAARSSDSVQLVISPARPRATPTITYESHGQACSRSKVDGAAAWSGCE